MTLSIPPQPEADPAPAGRKPRKSYYVPTGKPRGRPKGSRSVLKPPEEQPPVPALAMTIETAARALECSPSSIKRLIANGTLQTISIGRSRRVLTASIERMLQGGGTPQLRKAGTP
jgi:excisionase family DNA binding protein